MAKPFRVLRGTVRLGILAAAIASCLPWGFKTGTTGVVPGASPFLALAALLTGAAGAFLILPAILALACLFWPRFFCRWLCPLGTCQTLVARIPCWRPAFLNRLPPLGKWLLGLGLGGAAVGYPFFIWLDPLAIFSGAIGRYSTISLTAGGAILLLALLAPGLWCGKLCPLGALQDFLAVRTKRQAPGRRAFLATLAGGGLGASLRLMQKPAPKQPALRPPGALPEASFIRDCARCGACARVCPSHLIRHGGTGTGLAAWLAPEVVFDEGDYCLANCVACGSICPTGAIPRFTAAEKPERKIGTAVIETDSCRYTSTGSCGICLEVCPYAALTAEADEANDRRVIRVNPARCTGCGYCRANCPSGIIQIRPLGK